MAVIGAARTGARCLAFPGEQLGENVAAAAARRFPLWERDLLGDFLLGRRRLGGAGGEQIDLIVQRLGPLALHGLVVAPYGQQGADGAHLFQRDVLYRVALVVILAGEAVNHLRIVINKRSKRSMFCVS